MLERFFTFFQTYRSGIFFFLFSIACVAFLVQWFAWIFGWGRFGWSTTPIGSPSAQGTGGGTGTAGGPAAGSRRNLRYLFSGAIVKIVNDFRHLLALIIVLIFGIALGYSLWKAASVIPTGEDTVIGNMKEALQAVVATLGGLVGSIIGYYFGESSVIKTPDSRSQPPAPDSSPMRQVSLPSQSTQQAPAEDTDASEPE